MGTYSTSRLNDTEALRIHFEGRVTLQDIIAAARRAAPEGQFVSDSRLWDFRDCELDLSRTDVMQLAELSKSLEPGRSRVAFVVAADLEYGLVRMFEGWGTDRARIIRIFRDAEEAGRWVSREDDEE